MRQIALLLLALALTAGVVACEDTAKKEEEQQDQPTATQAAPTSAATNIPLPDVSAQPTTTASGLQIIDVEAGEGQAVVATDSVTVHYTGWLEDGTTFDSSVARGQPATFALDGVIAGWTEGLQGMQVGGKRRLIIPSDLAYGEEGRGETIPPNSTLIFDIELISIS
jgi:FKBP-type peptidyl-prolyl cis-trans isomerase